MKWLTVLFILLFPTYLFATDGVNTVQNPAAVNSVAVPDKVNTVAGLAGAVATNFTNDANCEGAWLFADNLNDS